MAAAHLHTVDAPNATAPPRTCRSTGCAQDACDTLGFCGGCRAAYDAQHRHTTRRIALAIALVRAAHPELFARLDRTPPLGERLAWHMASYVLDDPDHAAEALSVEGLDDFLAELAGRKAER